MTWKVRQYPYTEGFFGIINKNHCEKSSLTFSISSPVFRKIRKDADTSIVTYERIARMIRDIFARSVRK